MTTCLLLNSRFAAPPRLTANVANYTQALTTLTPLVKEHLRLTTAQLAAQAATVAQYIKAAIAAAENYTNRDLVPHVRTYLYDFPYGTTFHFRHGPATITSVKNSAAVVQVVNTDYTALYGDAGLALGIISADGYAYEIVLATGYADAANFPPEFVQFILVACGAFYEIREMANYTSMVQDADFLPMYLLDPIKIYSIA